MKWLVKALLGGWYLLGAEDRRKQKRGLVAEGCAAAGGMKGENSMERQWVADGIAAEREVGRRYSHLDHVRESGFEDAAVGSRRRWDLDG